MTQNNLLLSIINENFFMVIDKTFNTLSNINIKLIPKSNELYLQIQPNLIFSILLFLKYHSYNLFRILIDLTVYDFFNDTQKTSPRFHIRYFLLSHVFNIRLTVMFTVPRLNMVSSSILIYKNAMGAEREVWDMFGIIFYGNQNLRRLLTDYGFPSYPLRKDYPLTGFLELIYDSTIKKLKYCKVELTQAFRVFSYWKVGKNI